MTTVTLEGTQELMKQREVAVILATGGMGLVRAAYSAGKPAYGVGPGNAPCYIEQSADVAKAARDIVTGKSFDNGVLCSSPNSVVVDRGRRRRSAPAVSGAGRPLPVGGRGRRAREGARHAAAAAQSGAGRQVGRRTSPRRSASACPPARAPCSRELKGVGRDYPLSIEKLCPVLSYYVVKDWREGCERCKEILRYGGMGHTMSIHSRNEQVILEFGLHKPAYRIVRQHADDARVDRVDDRASIPAMTLGCGGFGGNITSDNISPRHLLNIKRLAYEIRPVAGCRGCRVRQCAAPGASCAGASAPPASPGCRRRRRSRHRNRSPPTSLTRRIDQFLASRGIGTSRGSQPHLRHPPAPAHPPHLSQRTRCTRCTPRRRCQFVCEDDVRTAVKAGEKSWSARRPSSPRPPAMPARRAQVFIWQTWPS